MTVILLDYTMLSNAVIAGRTCYQSWHLGGNYSHATDQITGNDKEYLSRLINKLKHKSIARHVKYVFSVKGMSTKTLLGLSRHQAGVDLSVMSSRYCKLEKFGVATTKTDNENLNVLVSKMTDMIQEFHLDNNVSAEDLAYAYPQAMQYDAVISFNLQSLQHFLEMRDSSYANFDIRDMAVMIRNAVPMSHRFLLNDS